MQTSINGIKLIKKFEGYRSCPYLCAADVPTIGYGATYYPSTKKKVTMEDECINESEAEEMLSQMLKRYEDGVARYVKPKLTSYQFDALVSFAYNCGLGALKSSTLLKRINNDPNDPDIARQFNRWNKANGLINRGLTKRRNLEVKMYFAL